MVNWFWSRKSSGRGEDIHIYSDGRNEREHLIWLRRSTEWANDFDLSRQARTMLRIWEADRIPNQEWTVTCTRRRKVGGIARLQLSVVGKLSNFPSTDSLESVVLSAGYGGGEYSVSSTRGPRFTHRMYIEGESEDPLSTAIQQDPKSAREETIDEVKTRLLNTAVGYLESDPAIGREVALKLLEKELGIKIRIPDRDAPLTYSELPVECQEWLDDRPEDKDAYMRKILGITEPEIEPTIEERVAEGVREQVVENVVANFVKRPSGWQAGLQELLSNSDLKEVIQQIGLLLSNDAPAEAVGESSEAGERRSGPVPIEPSEMGFNLN